MTLTSIFRLVPYLIGVADCINKKLDLIQKELKRMADQFTTDVQALQAAVAANTEAINNIASLVNQDKATIETLNQQIADLKANNPALDLTGLEAATASLAANNTTLTSVLAPVVPPAPVA